MSFVPQLFRNMNLLFKLVVNLGFKKDPSPKCNYKSASCEFVWHGFFLFQAKKHMFLTKKTTCTRLGIHEMAYTAIVNGIHERRQNQFFRLLTLPGRFSLWNFMYSLHGHLTSLEYNSRPKISMLIADIRWHSYLGIPKVEGVSVTQSQYGYCGNMHIVCMQFRYRNSVQAIHILSVQYDYWQYCSNMVAAIPAHSLSRLGLDAINLFFSHWHCACNFMPHPFCTYNINIVQGV